MEPILTSQINGQPAITIKGTVIQRHKNSRTKKVSYYCLINESKKWIPASMMKELDGEILINEWFYNNKL